MPFRPPKPLPEPRERLADVLAEVRTTEVRSGRLITDVLAGGFRSTFRGAGVEFSEVRLDPRPEPDIERAVGFRGRKHPARTFQCRSRAHNITLGAQR